MRLISRKHVFLDSIKAKKTFDVKPGLFDNIATIPPRLGERIFEKLLYEFESVLN